MALCSYKEQSTKQKGNRGLYFQLLRLLACLGFCFPGDGGGDDGRGGMIVFASIRFSFR